MTTEEVMAVWGMGSLFLTCTSAAIVIVAMIWDQSLVMKIAGTFATLGLFSLVAALWVQAAIDRAGV